VIVCAYGDIFLVDTRCIETAGRSNGRDKPSRVTVVELLPREHAVARLFLLWSTVACQGFFNADNLSHISCIDAKGGS